MANARSAIVSFDIDPRRAARLDLTLNGEFVTDAGSHPCTVNDISYAGARMTGKVELEPGDTGILKCDELDILTEVRWRAEDTYGLLFAEPINEDVEVEAMDEEARFEEVHRRANNRRFLRLFWNLG